MFVDFFLRTATSNHVEIEFIRRKGYEQVKFDITEAWRLLRQLNHFIQACDYNNVWENIETAMSETPAGKVSEKLPNMCTFITGADGKKYIVVTDEELARRVSDAHPLIQTYRLLSRRDALILLKEALELAMQHSRAGIDYNLPEDDDDAQDEAIVTDKFAAALEQVSAESVSRNFTEFQTEEEARRPVIEMEEAELPQRQNPSRRDVSARFAGFNRVANQILSDN